jgi:hypothetical protein
MAAFLWRFNAVALYTGCMCALSASAVAAQHDDRLVRGAAIDQANLEYGLSTGPKPKTFGESDFVVQLVRAQDSVRLYRAIVQSSENRHPYTVLIVGARVFHLGGFTAPELVAAAKLWRALGLDPGPERRAAALARMADWNGAQDIVDPTAPNTERQVAAIRKRWSELADSNWPRDTTLVGEDGSAVVTFTIFSRAVQDFVDGWDPVLYRMQFAPSGELVAWASRNGPRFSSL